MLQCGKSLQGPPEKCSRANRADLRRRHLLDTARTLFINHGFHQTGMAQIAAASEIKVGQIYRDFDSKEAIIAAIAEMDVTAWLEEDVLAAAVAAGDRTAIRAWIGRFGDDDGHQRECRLMTEVVAESGRNPRIADIYRAVDVRVRARLTAALAALAPSCDRPAAMALLIEFVMTLGMGMTACRVIHPDLPMRSLGRFAGRVIDRELDELIG